MHLLCTSNMYCKLILQYVGNSKMKWAIFSGASFGQSCPIPTYKMDCDY
jgi:hypothetical protein